MNYMVDCSCGSFILEYRREQSLINLDNVFHLLDGKGSIKYPHDLVTIIKTAVLPEPGQVGMLGVLLPATGMQQLKPKHGPSTQMAVKRFGQN